MKLKFASIIGITICLSSFAVTAQSQEIKNRLDPEDYDYVLADGVSTKEITFYSEGVACWAKIFFPKGFAAADNAE